MSQDGASIGVLLKNIYHVVGLLKIEVAGGDHWEDIFPIAINVPWEYLR